MKKIFFCLLLSFSAHNSHGSADVPAPFAAAYQETLKNIIDTFFTDHINVLSAEEKQFFANFVYLSYALSALDTHVRSATYTLMHHAWTARKDILRYADPSDQFTQLHAVAQDLEYVTQQQQRTLKAWQLCTSIVDEGKTTTKLVDAIEKFRLHVQQEVTQWASNTKDIFATQLADSSKTLLEASRALNMVGNSYTALHEGELPLLASPEFADVVRISVASRASNFVDEHCEHAFDAVASMNQSEGALQQVGLFIFYNYYTAIYTELQQLDPLYRTMLFDEDGLIALEQRVQLLPQPFSRYMLATKFTPPIA